MLEFIDVTQGGVQMIDRALNGGVPGDWFTSARAVLQQSSMRMLTGIFR
jgi:hypothetical protein